MSAQKYILLTLTLLAVTLTLSECCRYSRGMVCIPDQRSCTSRGGKCSVVGRACSCVPARQFYGYPSQQLHESSYDAPSYESGQYYGQGYGRYGGYNRRPYIDPSSDAHPMSESNMEQRTNMMVAMTRMYNQMNRMMT